MVKSDTARIPFDLSPDDVEVIRAVQAYTVTTPTRVSALCQAVRYIVGNGIDGALVECGVWRGGSMMAVARTLLALGATERELFLFDTFAGMTPPTSVDCRRGDGVSATELLTRAKRTDADNIWCIASKDDVWRNMRSTGYPSSRIHLIAGPVEVTIPDSAPQLLSLARLDTDWYTSTLHELSHLYPRIAQHGVLIVDDYGEWEGAKRATDEYFESLQFKPMLCRVDVGARIAFKPH